MAAIFYSPVNSNPVFKNNIHVNTSISIPFLNKLVGATGFLIINEVAIQNRDTIQYFLTFDDFISYYYFGKGLGSINISGMLFSDCNGRFKGVNSFTGAIADIRGRRQVISFGNVVFTGVLSSFTIRAASEDSLNNVIEFNLQLDIIDHSLTPPRFNSVC